MARIIEKDDKFSRSKSLPPRKPSEQKALEHVLRAKHSLDWEKEQDSSIKGGLFTEQGSPQTKEKKHLCSYRMALTVPFQGESLYCPVRWPSIIVPPFLYLSSADKYKWSYLQEIWTEIPVLYKQWVKMETGGMANKEVFQAAIWIAWQVGYKQLFPINSNQRKTQISRRKNEIISTFEILFNINISLWGWALCSRPSHRKDRHCCQVLLQGLVSTGLQLVLRKTSPFLSTGLIPQVPATHSYTVFLIMQPQASWGNSAAWQN